jgi:hypothetical protein
VAIAEEREKQANLASRPRRGARGREIALVDPKRCTNPPPEQLRAAAEYAQTSELYQNQELTSRLQN